MPKYSATWIYIEGVTGKAAPPFSVIMKESVDRGGDLVLTSSNNRGYQSLIIQLAELKVPKIFLVVVPDGVGEFTRPHIFFHPTPMQAGYQDANYGVDNKKWQELFRYADIMGAQLASSDCDQILIIPILTESVATNMGTFATDWREIITEVLDNAAKACLAGGLMRPEITDVVLSSYSAGIRYLVTFKNSAPGLNNYLREIYDFDGAFSSSYGNLSASLTSTKETGVFKYDQLSLNPQAIARDAGTKNLFHLPLNRWKKAFPTALGPMDIHPLISGYMLYHALSHGNVGKH